MPSAPRAMSTLISAALPPIVSAAGLLLAVIAPGIFGAAAPAWQAGGLALAMLVLVATAAAPEAYAAILFFAGAAILGVAPPDTVFSGFHSGAFWLVLSGLVFGAAARHAGLADRLARQAAGVFGTSYAALIAGMVAAGVLLAFLVPAAVGRVALLVPIALALAERAGYDAGHPGRTGLVMAAALGTFFPPFGILPANVPNMILTGAAETLYDHHFSYGGWLALHFPVLGILKAVLLVVLLVRLFPAPPPREAGAMAPGAAADPRALGRLALILGATLVLWATDWLHGLKPAWVGLSAAALILTPGLRLVPADFIRTGLPVGTLIFIAAMLSLGAVISAAGLGDAMGGVMIDLAGFEPGADAINVYKLGLISTAVGLLGSLHGTPAILTPLAGRLAEATGLSLDTVLMTQALGFSTALLPYQSPPVIVALGLAGIGQGPAARAMIALGLATMLLLWPLDLVWWTIIGRI
ncbi:SLC13 family permease [Tistrella mobilis]|uniref:SLC13 family permease n=1 Tax=Tistrella mobilis TaxID=171437 RepID=UPI003558BE34